MLAALFFPMASAGEKLGELEGTGVAGLGEDNPQDGGWETEVWTGEMMKSLKLLESAFEDGELEGVVEKLFEKDSRVSKLRQDDLVRVDARVMRAKLEGEMKRSNEVLSSLKSLSDIFSGTFERHAKGKIVKIQKTGERQANTLVYFQIDGVDAKEEGMSLQVNTRWTCGWKKREGKWKLGSIGLVSYEEVRAKKDLFRDVTGSVFEGQDELKAQLFQGQDHWMARVEMKHGIDVGGWQGIAVADVDGDGLEDVYVSQPGGLPNRLLKHLPDGRVEDISKRAGVDWLEGTHGSLFADLDNDGDPDLIVGVAFGVLVMENDGKGNFSVRSTELMTDGLPYSIAAADVDYDGDLDFFVCGYNPRAGVSRHHVFAHPVPYHDANNGGRNALFRNDGNWRFTDVTKRTGLGENNTRFSYAASWEDYDWDGDLDLYVANDFGKNSLYQNEYMQTGRVRFTDVAEAAGVVDVAPGMSVDWGDFNNDGWADLYVGNMFSSAGNRIANQSRFHQGANAETKSHFLRHARGNSLFQNLGGGKFGDVGDDLGVTMGRWAWSSKFVDLDNDGWEDILVANGFVTQEDTGDL